MAHPLKFTNEQILQTYARTGSVWRAAKELGACGQSVWERLRILGVKLPGSKWTEEEITELRLLAPQCTIGEIARRLGRPYSGVAGMISKLEIGVRFGNHGSRKLPRGSGLTARSTPKLMAELMQWRGSIRQFCVRNSLQIERLIIALQRYVPEEWRRYVRAHAELKPKKCPECSQEFYALNSKQMTCSRLCASRRRSNLEYFGGRRSFAVGMEEGICQLCERSFKTRLAAHHVFGKKHDPDNEYLVALCNGCHQIVTLLAARVGATRCEFWENLISLAVMRHEGHRKPLGHHVTVEIEELTREDILAEEVPQGVQLQ